MLLLQLVLKICGPQKVDVFLSKTNILNNMTQEEGLKFIKQYLKYPFDERKENKFIVLDYIECLQLLYELDEVLINSNYFKTMPSFYINELFLKRIDFFSFRELPGLTTYLLDKIDKPEDLNFIKESKRKFLQLPNLIEKLLSYKDMNLIINYLDYLTLNEKNNLKKELSNYFTLEEIKQFCLKDKNFNINDLNLLFSSYIKKEEKEALDAILEIVINKNIGDNSKINLNDLKEKKLTHFVYYYFKQKMENPSKIYIDFSKLIENDDAFNNENKEILAKKILELNDPELMAIWLINTKCEANYEIIDKLIEHELIIPSLLLKLNNDYVYYILNKLTKGDFCVINYLSNLLCEKANPENIEKIDEMLSFICNRRKTIGVSQNNAVNLLSYGTSYFDKIIEKYNLKAEECLFVLKKLLQIGRVDLVAIYGPYLLTGNKMKLLNPEEISNSTKELKRLNRRK